VEGEFAPVVIMLIVYWVSLVFLALIPASIAKSKGRGFLLWYLYSYLMFAIALVHAIVLRPRQETAG